MKSSQYLFDSLDSSSSSRYKYTFNGSKDIEVNHGSPIFNTSPSRNYFSKSKRNEESNNNSSSKEVIISVPPPFLSELASSKDFMKDRKIKSELMRDVRRPNYELKENILDSLNFDSLTENNEINDASNMTVFESFNQETKINLPKGERKELFPTKLPSHECNRYKATPEFQKYQTRTSSQKVIHPFFKDKSSENVSFFKKNSQKNKENELNGEKKKELFKYFDLPLQYTRKRSDSFYKDASETMDENVGMHNEVSFDFNHKFYNNFLKNKENNQKYAQNCNKKDVNKSYDKQTLDSERLKSPILSINFRDNNLKSNTSNETTTACFSSMENTDPNRKCNPFYVFNMELISSHCLSPVDKEKIINLIQNNINDVKIISSNESILCDKTNLKLENNENKKKNKQDVFDLPNRQTRNKSFSKITTNEENKLANQRKHSLNSINHQKAEQYLTNKKNSPNLINLIYCNSNTSEDKKMPVQNNNEAYKKAVHGMHRKAISNLDGKENLNDSNYLKRVKVKDIITEFECFKHDFNPNQAKIGDEKNIVFEKKELKQILSKKQLFSKRAELELKPNLKPVKINLF